MDRRTFIKLMGGLASIPVLGKFAKPAAKVAQVSKVASTAGKLTETQSILPDLISVVMKKGKEIDSGIPNAIAKEYKGVRVYESPDEINVEFMTDKGNGAFASVKKADYIVDEKTGKSVYKPPEYEEGQQVYRAYGPDDYSKDVEFEIMDSVSGLKKIAQEGKTSKGIETLTESVNKMRQSKADGGRVGLQAGGPPIYQTTDPKEAVKEIIRQTPFLGGAPDVFPIYADENSAISFNVGRPGLDPFQFGISGSGKYFGDIEVGVGNQGIGAYHSAQTPIPGVTSQISYNEESGPRLDLMYQKRFANGGLTDTIPPEKGPMSQGIESLFQTR